MTGSVSFPRNFLWGCATSAYQVEGAPLADGAGASIWQRFSHDPRLMAAKGDTGDMACDHYNRMQSDVALMKQLGLQAYRFSTAWGRVLPDGVGQVNQKGLDFYERLVDTLLENGIEPMLTLYHWDMPAALDDRGGWLNPDSAHWFADYGHIMFERLDGRVQKWVTINEPWVIADGGYLNGLLAPGHRNVFEAPIVSHNLMRAHGAAVKTYRDMGAHEIGLVVNIEPKYPASASAADVEAAARADAYMNRQYLDPALRGGYPEEMREIFGEAWPEWPDEDLQLIRQPIDFIGINYYTRAVVEHDAASWPLRAVSLRQSQSTYTETGWEVFAKGLTDTLLWVKDRYGDIPLYVTENGAAFYDPPKTNGSAIEDPLRVSYLTSHIAALSDAISAGVEVRGYMLWSLFDNLEWSLGYSKRFGILHVDFDTFERTPKASAQLYSQIIASNGAILNGSSVSQSEAAADDIRLVQPQ